MSKRKALCFVLSVCLLFCCSCGGGVTSSDGSPVTDNQTDTTPADQKFGLLYCAKDLLNPFEATTKANQELGLLLFDPLFKLDDNFKLVNVLAKSFEQKDNTITVTLKNQLKFSDASAITADDIVFSFDEAKKSENYKYTLSGIVSCERVSDNSVSFKTAKKDIFAVNLLTFPIVKSGSTERFDADNVALEPIGCGRYVFDRAQTALILNNFYHTTGFNIKKIYLTNAPDNEVVEHNIKVGNTDIYYNSTAEPATIRMSDSKRKYLNTTNLVYLGANTKSSVAKSSYVRYAVSAAIDREAVVKQSYYASAKAAIGIFHPDFEPAKPYQTIQTSPKKEISVVNLEQIGYNSMDSEGYYVNKSGKRLNVSILVNSDNTSRLAAARLIEESLKSAGIAAKVSAVPYAQYISRIKTGSYDFYLGEVRLNANMDISELVYPGGSAAYGVSGGATESETSQTEGTESNSQADVSYTVWQILDRFYSGKATVADIVNIFESELPLIPVCYLSSSLFYNENLTSEPEGFASDIFNGIENYSFKN